MELGICQARQIQAIPNGVTPAGRSDRSCVAGLRGQLGVGERDLLDPEPARLAPDKGLTYLIEAAAVLPTRKRRYRFLIAATARCAIAWSAWRTTAGSRTRSRFSASARDIGDLLAACDLVALPSLREGLSISLLEAMAAGKPIIATSIGSHREVASQARNGAARPAGESDGTGGSHSAVRARSRTHGTSRGGRASLFEARYTEERMLNEYRQLYLELLEPEAASAALAALP